MGHGEVRWSHIQAMLNTSELDLSRTGLATVVVMLMGGNTHYPLSRIFTQTIARVQTVEQ